MMKRERENKREEPLGEVDATTWPRRGEEGEATKASSQHTPTLPFPDLTHSLHTPTLAFLDPQCRCRSYTGRWFGQHWAENSPG